MPGHAREGKMRSKLREAILVGFSPPALSIVCEVSDLSHRQQKIDFFDIDQRGFMLEVRCSGGKTFYERTPTHVAASVNSRSVRRTCWACRRRGARPARFPRRRWSASIRKRGVPNSELFRRCPNWSAIAICRTSKAINAAGKPTRRCCGSHPSGAGIVVHRPGRQRADRDAGAADARQGLRHRHHQPRGDRAAPHFQPRAQMAGCRFIRSSSALTQSVIASASSGVRHAHCDGLLTGSLLLIAVPASCRATSRHWKADH